MKKIPAIIQEKPTPLQNLLLMFNIHALREQWDYLTIANKLPDVIALFSQENDGREPNEQHLSELTGLTRGQNKTVPPFIRSSEKIQTST